MIKKNLWKYILSSVLTLLPVLYLIPLSSYSEIVKMGFGWSFVIIPIVTCLINIALLVIESIQYRKYEQSPKITNLTYWVIPFTSIYVSSMMFALASGLEISVPVLVAPLLGVMFIVMGNYMPKARQTRTFGIKIKWTLENEENWNATHRFAGKAWVLGGLLILFTALLPEDVMMIVTFFLLFATAFIPMFYSYFYYRKQLKAGTYVENNTIPKSMNKTSKVITLIVLPLILIGVVVMMLVGTIALTYGESSFTVEATFSDSRTVEYDAVDSIEYREDFDKGTRIFGFSSARLLTGTFSNDEFGSYTLYSYTTCDSAVIIKVGNKTLAISGADNQITKEIYDTLLSKCPGGSK